MTQKFHKFKAETFDQAYQTMRKRLGEDAVVIRTTTVTEGGILGLLGHKMVELTASAPVVAPPRRALTAVERRYLASSGVEQDSGDAESPTPAPTAETGQTETLAFFEKLVSDAQRRMTVERAKRSRSTITGGASSGPVSEGNAAIAHEEPVAQPAARPGVRESILHEEIREVRDLLHVLAAERPDAGLDARLTPYYQMLLDRGVERNRAAALVHAVAKSGDPEALRSERLFREQLKMTVRKDIDVTGGISLAAGTCRVVALAGATGVGKTTNLAKIAALFAVRERARVGLITADTYRVGATHQLRTYADIIGLEMRVVHDRREMAASRRVFQDYDLVLVDTAGGSPFNTAQVDDTRGLLEAAEPDEVMLVVGAGTPLEDLRSAITRFSVLQPTSLLFTKLDETKRFGSAFCFAAETGLPLSYLSNGQNVPDDLVLAHHGMVANLVIEGGDRRGRSSEELT